MKFSLGMVMILALGLLTSATAQQNSDEDRLRADLLQNYDKLQLPSPDEITQVDLGMRLKKLKRLDFDQDAIKMKAWMPMSWIDSRLAWDPAEYGDIASINMSPSDIWVPDMTLYNSRSKSKVGTDARAILDHSGNISYTPRLSIDANCTLDIEGYPYDTHNCSLTWGSWSWSHSRLSPIPSSNVIDLSKYREDPLWEVVSTQATKISHTYACCAQLFEDIVFSLVVRRRLTQ